MTPRELEEVARAVTEVRQIMREKSPGSDRAARIEESTAHLTDEQRVYYRTQYHFLHINEDMMTEPFEVNSKKVQMIAGLIFVGLLFVCLIAAFYFFVVNPEQQLSTAARTILLLLVSITLGAAAPAFMPSGASLSGNLPIFSADGLAAKITDSVAVALISFVILNQVVPAGDAASVAAEPSPAESRATD